MIKTKTLFSLLAALSLLLTGCGDNNQQEQTSEKEKYINIQGNESIEVKSDASVSLKNFNFYDATPIFMDSHIDHFVVPRFGERLIVNIRNEGFYVLNINLKAKSSGGLYFNIDYSLDEDLKDAFRIELYSQSINKSVIYSFKGGESLTEGKADLNGDQEFDKDGSGEEIIYTTGEHSYDTEAFNTNPYTNLNENDEISIKATIYFDGFYIPSNTQSIRDLPDLNMLFEIR